MNDQTFPIRITQATAIATLSTASGLSLGLSCFVIPRLLESPTPLMLKQWGNMYAVSSRTMPPALILPTLMHAFLAYHIPAKMRVYAVAAAVGFSITAWSRLLVIPVNRKLLKKVDDVKMLYLGPGDVLAEEQGRGEETAHALIDKWGVLNLYRGAAAFTAGILGLYAALF